ncbi:MAG: hypothetical protein AAFY56_03415 [Pseudomonadota bacterium]
MVVEHSESQRSNRIVATGVEEKGESSGLHEGQADAFSTNHANNEIVTAAVLATTAFRLRDEQGLLRSLRLLSDAVQKHESASVSN